LNPKSVTLAAAAAASCVRTSGSGHQHDAPSRCVRMFRNQKISKIFPDQAPHGHKVFVIPGCQLSAQCLALTRQRCISGVVHVGARSNFI
jgi:hypothetical protein